MPRTPWRLLLAIGALLLLVAPRAAEPQAVEPAGSGQALVDRLSPLLSSPDRNDRLAAMRQLSRLEAVPSAALPLLRQGLADPDETVRMTSAATLSGLTAAAPEAVGAAAAALKDASPLVRQFAVRAAACLKETSGAGLELTRAAALDPEPAVRSVAATEPRRIEGVGGGVEGVRSGMPAAGDDSGDAGAGQGGTPGAASPATPTSRATSPPSGEGGAEGGTAQPTGPAAVPQLIGLGDPRPEARLQAAQALGDMGSRAITALPALERARADANARVRQKAEWAIAQIWRPKPNRSDQPAVPPRQGRVYFLADIVSGCDESGPETQTELTRTSPGNTADLFELAEVAWYREDARRRGLKADAPLDELTKDKDTWPQPGWWRAEWDDVLPAEAIPAPAGMVPGPEPEQAAETGEERDQLLDDLNESLDQIAEARALEERWIGGLWDALCTAERRKAEAIVLLRAQAEQSFRGLACDPGFGCLDQSGITASTQEPSVLYIDNLAINLVK